MFTGIVEELGSILAIVKTAKMYQLTVANTFDDIQLGDSIAVNGVCLTASVVSKHRFVADVMPETLSRTCFCEFQKGTKVNLERAMQANGRFGGHIVSGHIDGIGTISEKRKDNNAIRVTIETNQEILRYIVEKGSIAIDGISLTVTEVNKHSFGISLIPHTVEHTTLHFKGIGAVVNLECDIIGKYVEKLMQPKEEKTTGLTMDFLTQNGF